MKPLGSSPPQTSRKWWTGAGVTYKLPHRCGHWCCRRGERRRRVGGVGAQREGCQDSSHFPKFMQHSFLSLAFLTGPGAVRCMRTCTNACRVPRRHAGRVFFYKAFKVSPHSAAASIRGPVEELLARLLRRLCNSLQRLSKHNAGRRDVVQVLTYFWASNASKMLHHKKTFSKSWIFSATLLKKSLNVYWCLSVHFESECCGSNSFATATPFQKRPFSFNPSITNMHPFSDTSPCFFKNFAIAVNVADYVFLLLISPPPLVIAMWTQFFFSTFRTYHLAIAPVLNNLGPRKWEDGIVDCS